MSNFDSTTHTILYIEDNPADAVIVRERLKTGSGMSPFHITHVPTLRQALEILQTSEFSVILLDLNLPETNGLETLTRIQSANSTTPIVVLTVTENEPMALEAIKMGAKDYIPKSQMNSVLLSRILQYAIEREKNERIRWDSERKYRLFVEGATGLAFILLDLDGKIIHWNHGAQRLFGYTEEAALNKYFSFLFPLQDQKEGRPETELRRARTDEKGNDDNWLVRADGTRFWASGAVTAVRDKQSQLIGFAKVVRDNSAKREANDKLAELNRTLEERVHQRTRELVRNQERLRSMASDLTLTEQRERRRLATDLHDYLAQLLVACRLKINQAQSLTDPQDLQKIIQEADTILDQSLEYTRTLVTQISPPCLYEFGLPAALVWLGTEMKKQGLQVEITGKNLAPNLVEEQAVLLYQSVRELLFNVIKHSGVNEATVSLSTPEDNFLQIEVGDHGCGIFKYPEEKDASSKFGLFSIRERLEALGGETVITSSPGKGTRILLRIPLENYSGELLRQIEQSKPVSAMNKTSIAETQKGKTRILLVDDHKMVREGFCHILNAQLDLEVVGEAENGQQAVTLCQSLRPDVVVMDLQMPIMDGREATRRIKEENPAMIVIGVSVHDTPEMAQRFREVGADEFITKGGPAENLVTAIRRFGPVRSS